MLNRSTAWAALAAFVACVLFAVWGKAVMALLLQPDYAEAHGAALIYLVATGLAMASFAFHPAALAMDRPAESFGVLLACTILYFFVLAPMISRWGLEGASAAYVVFYLSWVGALRWRLSTHLKEAAAGA
jgi:O-antigen/teichoic acid export membrane protein